MGTTFVNWKAQHVQEDQCPQTVLQNQCNLSWKPVVFVFKDNSKLILKFIWKCKGCKVAKTILGDYEVGWWGFCDAAARPG